jgi:hypothetical protein
LSQLAMIVVDGVQAFLDQFDAACALRDEIRPSFMASVDHIAVRREQGITVLTDLERVAEYEQQVAKVRRAFAGLESVLAIAESWVTVAKVSAVRTAEAAGRLIVSESVSDLTVTLQHMATKVQVLRSTESPAIDEVLQAIRKAEHLNETHIRIPEIIWPEGGDMFAPPKLREWQEESR